MTQQFNHGDTVYLGDGVEARYLCQSYGERHVVEKAIYFGGYDEAPGYSEPVVVDLVYAELPIEKRHDEAKRLDELIEAKRAELETLRVDVRSALAERNALADKLRELPALKHLDAFLSGAFTHYVEAEYGQVTIKDAATALNSRDRYDNGHRLLTLFGDTSGNLQWRLNRYKDDSGNWADIYPCLSLEEATAKARELIEAGLKSDRCIDYWIKSAKLFDVPVPTELFEQRKAAQLHILNDHRAKLAKQLTDVDAKLAALTN